MKIHKVYQIGNKLYNMGSLITSSKNISYTNGHFSINKGGRIDVYSGRTGAKMFEGITFF